jgi:predicted DNA-binding transcriptional regulator AlpA
MDATLQTGENLPEFITGEEEMRKLLGLRDRGTLRDWERRGIFPKRIKIGPSRVGWLRSDYLNFVNSRKAAAAKQ